MSVTSEVRAMIAAEFTLNDIAILLEDLGDIDNLREFLIDKIFKDYDIEAILDALASAYDVEDWQKREGVE